MLLPCARILLAEDEDIIAFIIEDLLRAQGMTLTVCRDGLMAWECLLADKAAYDVILLDRLMPGLDGMELLGRIKADPALAEIPVIIETALGDEASIRQGLAQGAYYYLTKPLQAEVLLAVVKAALHQSQVHKEMVGRLGRAERPLALLQQGSFRFRDLEQGDLLASYLALACPQPEKVVLGLQELLVNAVEHGNLGITDAEKSALLLAGTWHHEIMNRLDLVPYRERCVVVDFQRQAQSLQFRIQDQGAGFDWQAYLDFSPERAFDAHGRGIAMAAKLSLDGLTYQGNGNTVLATVNLEPGQPRAGV